MRGELTERLQRILEFIQNFMDKAGYPPTVREIGEGIGVKSTSLISYYLDRLEEQNRIVRDRSVSRGIRMAPELSLPLLLSTQETVSVPYFGYIVASAPIPVEPLPGEETIELNRALFGTRVSDMFALRVQGDSMIDALIHDGDLVVLRHQKQVENGEMAAVWIPDTGETTLKKVYYEGAQIRLQPANPMMEPIYFPTNQVQIQGKVVLVIRQLD